MKQVNLITSVGIVMVIGGMICCILNAAYTRGFHDGRMYQLRDSLQDDVDNYNLLHKDQIPNIIQPEERRNVI